MQKALFLDRDGVVCKETPRGIYLLKVDDFEIKEGIQEVVRAASAAGYMIFIATNQAAVARGLLSVEELEKMHEKMHEQVPGIDKVYMCIHGKDEGCVCRKPRPGMILQAVQEFGVDLKKSVFVGDNNTDIEAGKAAGISTTIFVQHDHNASELERCTPSHVVTNVKDIIHII